MKGYGNSAVTSAPREVRVTETLKKGTRVTGADRTKLASDRKKRYGAGESIRSLAASTGRSYGFIHRILSESGVSLRGRGGATRGKAKAKARPGTRAVPSLSTDLVDLTGTGLELSLSGSVATVTLARPERRNAMTPGMWR